VELFQLAAIAWGAIPTKQVKQRLKATSRRANRFIKFIFPNTASYSLLFYRNPPPIRD
jgi:hypothetical protein